VKHLLFSFALIALLVLPGCGNWFGGAANVPPLVDPGATRETRALFVNLDRLRADHVLFGHQDAVAYGVKWRDDSGRSDVREVTGSHPALYGWDVGHIELGRSENLDRVDFDNMRRWIQEAYERGGVITLSWHLNHPATGRQIPATWETAGSSWDTTAVIRDILPGGQHEALFNEWLDRLAGFMKSLQSTGRRPHPVPVIFRPWHEMSGHWFWWGTKAATPEEYIELWQYTVHSLRDKRGVHNLLYAWSPNSLNELDWADFWQWYPGDAYVDIIGFDDYFTLQGGYGDEQPVERFTAMLRYLVEASEARGKIPALTETGLEALRIPDWYTQRLLKAIQADSVAARIAYVHVWRNANEDVDRAEHFYAPYPGHASADDFIRFRQDPMILFEDDLPPMYR
jgi:mannan endo-1,4-beta-mannosidase